MVFCVLLEGFFSGSEIAIVSVDKAKLHNRGMEGSKQALYLQKLLLKPEILIGTTLLGTNLSTVGANFAANELFSRIFDPSYSWASVFVTIPMILFFAEIMPKAIFRKNAETLSYIVVKPLRFVSYIFYPFVTMLSLAGNGIRRLLIGKTAVKNQIITREEFKMLLDQDNFTSQENLTIHMLDKLSAYIEKTLSDIAIPMINLTHCEPDATYREVLDILLKSGLSRIPVYDKSTDELLGFVNDLYLLEPANRKKKAAQMVKPPLFIPENLEISRALIMMRKEHRETAVVIDEYGGTVGIVTLKDIVGEITGKLTDNDEVSQGGYIHKVSANTLIVDSNFKLDELEQHTGTKFDVYPFETLNGLINYILGRVAKKGDICSYKNLVFRILRSRPQRAEMIRVHIKKRIKTEDGK
jgi:CBS domain containing-hemolysin-like protein